ncbi:MAG: hypothetical protein IJ594_07570 [Oscillospiraceae bacterium]|nr:hypothetical protein [Oscillospiraceae bacterium]
MKKRLVTALGLLLALSWLPPQSVYADETGGRPVAENLELRTYSGVTVGGTLSGFDPDGAPLRFEITTGPVKGEIELCEDGSFLYTPQENKRGRDYFGYKAIDPEGNLSQEATVIIQILRQKHAFRYADMSGRSDEYAATALSELGLFTGRQICGQYCFEPDSQVTRGEFISMCMMLTGKPLLTGICRTGYEDDEAIPAWQKAYARTAALQGVYNGAKTAAGSVFLGDEALSYAEAVLLLDSALHLENVSYLDGFEEMDPGLAQACANLNANGVIRERSTAGRLLNRSDAARMLTAAADLLDKR